MMVTPFCRVILPRQPRYSDGAVLRRDFINVCQRCRIVLAQFLLPAR